MKTRELVTYCASRAAAVEDHPWGASPTVFKVGGLNGPMPAAGRVRIHVVGRLSALVGDVENLWMSVQLGWKVVDNPYCGDVRWGPMILESRRGSTIRV